MRGGGDNTSATHDPSCEEGVRGGGDTVPRNNASHAHCPSCEEGDRGGDDNASHAHNPSCEEGVWGGGDNMSRARCTLSVDLRCAKWAIRLLLHCSHLTDTVRCQSSGRSSVGGMPAYGASQRPGRGERARARKGRERRLKPTPSPLR